MLSGALRSQHEVSIAIELVAVELFNLANVSKCPLVALLGLIKLVTSITSRVRPLGHFVEDFSLERAHLFQGLTKDGAKIGG